MRRANAKPRRTARNKANDPRARARGLCPRAFPRSATLETRESEAFASSVLALPIFELRSRPGEHDALALDAARTDLSRVQVLDEVGRDQRREHQHADRRVGRVLDLMRAFLAAGKADDVALP